MLNLIRCNQSLKQQRSRCSSAGWRVLGKEGERMAKWCRERRLVPDCKNHCESMGRDGNRGHESAKSWECSGENLKLLPDLC